MKKLDKYIDIFFLNPPLNAEQWRIGAAWRGNPKGGGGISGRDLRGGESFPQIKLLYFASSDRRTKKRHYKQI